MIDLNLYYIVENNKFKMRHNIENWKFKIKLVQFKTCKWNKFDTQNLKVKVELKLDMNLKE